MKSKTAIIGLILLCFISGLSMAQAGPKNQPMNLNSQLMNMVNTGNINEVKALLQKGADVNAKFSGMPLLWWAHNADMARLLTENGANINARDNNGNTVLMWLSGPKLNEDVARILIEKEADLNARNNEGWTALMGAADNGSAAIAHLLIEKGAQVNVRDKYGRTALMMAEQQPYYEIVHILKEAGARENPAPTVQKHMPAKDAQIVDFNISAVGTLHIIFSDGAEVEIPKERGRFAIGEQILTQETFSDIQLADDHQHIGWLAEYMICAQSNPCPAELGVYQPGHKLKYIRPEYGIFWRWKFLEAGKQIVVQYGFPHGDSTGSYALYDTETVHELANFSATEYHVPVEPKDMSYGDKKKAPDWVHQLLRSNR